MFCSNCGNQLTDHAKFCEKCGTPVGSGSVQQAKEDATIKTTFIDKSRVKSLAGKKQYIIAIIAVIVLSLMIPAAVKLNDTILEAEDEVSTILTATHMAKTEDEKEEVVRKAKKWLKKTEHSLIDGASKEQREYIEEYVENEGYID